MCIVSENKRDSLTRDDAQVGIAKAVPVNSFSKNYSGDGGGKGENGGTFDSLENFLYRAKKWQYVFYKTCLLHGLNVSAAIGFGRSRSDRSSTSGTFFQLYWLCLNASYVMEFFCRRW